MNSNDPHYWSSIIFAVAESCKNKSQKDSLSDDVRMSHATSAEHSLRIATDVLELELKGRQFDEISEFILGSEQLMQMNKEAMKRSRLNPTVTQPDSLCSGKKIT